MCFELIISSIALVVSCCALVVSIRQSNLAKVSNRLALRKDYVDNYNLMSKAFGIWNFKGKITDEFTNLVSEALRHSKLLLTNDITEFLENLHSNIFKIYRANIYIKGENDNLQPEAVAAWNKELTNAKKAFDEINVILTASLIERYRKYTELPNYRKGFHKCYI